MAQAVWKSVSSHQLRPASRRLLLYKIMIEIIDESGDKKYFTQLPSIILNHSTAIDQALYWQMKRYAGEDGKCFATQETLMKKMSIGKWAYRKSLNYLLKRGWIKYVGMTQGKTRPIKTYSIVDIWKENIMEYEKISPKVAVSFNQEIPSSLAGDTVQNGSKIPASLAIEEEQYKEEPEEEVISPKKMFTYENETKVFAPTQEIIKYFINLVKETKSIDMAINWKKEGSLVKSFLKSHSVEQAKDLIGQFLKSESFEFNPSISYCFSSNVVNKWKLNRLGGRKGPGITVIG